ncbi:ABC transporter permease [Kyrpidia spormannii]|uniref:Transport permease protein n=2 Tax=Kyrpidia spormannii TaxID=2055160 RepID=A0A2K8N3N9_9BACL|nr:MULTISPECIES: ABC transporter permease [Kyrpidia]ATY84083.1 ABC transporter permease [Kyrpidia spormannii]MCL6575070.1 ABC transporter permease [Kyrpidia sp.]CAB3390235.1 Transport permease protein [Kyrpidia spormannii]CAB3391158.1 Transport permease protein [Kyrpidia spormannii]
MSARAVWAVFARNMDVFRRYWLNNLVSNFFEPFLYLLGMGVGMTRYVGGIDGVSYTAFIAPGIVASTAMFAATFESTYGTFVRMEFQKTFDAMIATPVNVEEVAVGELVYGAVKAAIVGVIILAVVEVFGFVPGWHYSALLVPPAALLVGLVFSALAMTASTLVPQIDHFNYYITLLITPMFVFSGIFFPLEGLPSAVQAVAWFTPLMHGVRMSRELIFGTWTHVWADALWLAVAAAALSWLPVILLRRRLIR